MNHVKRVCVIILQHLKVDFSPDIWVFFKVTYLPALTLLLPVLKLKCNLTCFTCMAAWYVHCRQVTQAAYTGSFYLPESFYKVLRVCVPDKGKTIQTCRSINCKNVRFQTPVCLQNKRRE